MKFRSLIPLLLLLILPSPIRFEKFNLLYAEESASKSSSNPENEQKIVTVEWDKIKEIFEKTHEITPEEAVERATFNTAEGVADVFSLIGGRKVDPNEKLGKGTFYTISGKDLAMGGSFYITDGSKRVSVGIGADTTGGRIDVVLAAPVTDNPELEYSFSTVMAEGKIKDIWKKIYEVTVRAVEQNPNLECSPRFTMGTSFLQIKVREGHTATPGEFAEAITRANRASLEIIASQIIGKAVKVYKRTVEADGKSYDVAVVVVHVYSAERTGRDRYDFMVVIKARDSREVYHAGFAIRLPKGQELLDVGIFSADSVTVNSDNGTETRGPAVFILPLQRTPEGKIIINNGKWILLDTSPGRAELLPTKKIIVENYNGIFSEAK